VPLLRDPTLDWDYPAITSYDYGEFSIRTERWRYTTYLDGGEELYDHNNDPHEWHNQARNPDFYSVIEEISKHIPQNPTPLVKTSLKLEPHHIPPFKSKAEYIDWINNNKDYRYIIDKYW
jgi:hypothetical protein